MHCCLSIFDKVIPRICAKRTLGKRPLISVLAVLYIACFKANRVMVEANLSGKHGSCLLHCELLEYAIANDSCASDRENMAGSTVFDDGTINHLVCFIKSEAIETKS